MLWMYIADKKTQKWCSAVLFPPYSFPNKTPLGLRIMNEKITKICPPFRSPFCEFEYKFNMIHWNALCN